MHSFAVSDHEPGALSLRPGCLMIYSVEVAVIIANETFQGRYAKGATSRLGTAIGFRGDWDMISPPSLLDLIMTGPLLVQSNAPNLPDELEGSVAFHHAVVMVPSHAAFLISSVQATKPDRKDRRKVKFTITGTLLAKSACSIRQCSPRCYSTLCSLRGSRGPRHKMSTLLPIRRITSSVL